MKKFLMRVLVLVIALVCLTSCKDTELIARVDGLENKVNELVAKVEEWAEFRLAKDFYGSVYKLDERSWDDLVDFYNTHEECQNESYADPYYFVWKRYESGKDEFLSNYAMTIAFKNDGILTLGVEGMYLDMSYTIVENDILIDFSSFAVLMGEDPEEYEDMLSAVKFKLGSISEDGKTLVVSTEIMESFIFRNSYISNQLALAEQVLFFI